MVKKFVEDKHPTRDPAEIISSTRLTTRNLKVLMGTELQTQPSENDESETQNGRQCCRRSKRAPIKVEPYFRGTVSFMKQVLLLRLEQALPRDVYESFETNLRNATPSNLFKVFRVMSATIAVYEPNNIHHTLVAVLQKHLELFSTTAAGASIPAGTDLPADFLPEMVALFEEADVAVDAECSQLKVALRLRPDHRTSIGDSLDGLESAFDLLPVLLSTTHLVSLLHKQKQTKDTSLMKGLLLEQRKTQFLLAADVFELVKPWCKVALKRLGIATSVFEVIEMHLEDSGQERYEHKSFFRRTIDFYRNRMHKTEKQAHELDKEAKVILEAINEQLVVFQGSFVCVCLCVCLWWW
jgi:hypothetical protein